MITIVVLLILAGVSINAVFSDNGIIKRAQEAQNKMDKAVENDQKTMNELSNWIDNKLEPKGEISSGEKDATIKTFDVTWVSGQVYNTYNMEEGMTWKEWINSEYNIDGWKIISNFPNSVVSKGSTADTGYYMTLTTNQHSSDPKDIANYGVKTNDVIDLTKSYMLFGYAD